MEEYSVLGMTLGHNATAAITIDGHIVACVSEERFTRIKNMYGYPQRAIAYCLHAAGMNANELDQVVIASHITPPLLQTENGLREATPEEKDNKNWFSSLSTLRNATKNIKSIEKIGYQTLAPLLAKSTHKKRVEIVSKLLGISPSKIIASEHHLTHAYAGIFASGFTRTLPEEECLVITVDGEGDMLSSTVGIFNPGTLGYRRIAQSSYAESIGHFYSAVTSYLGMKVLEHEYKVMGLAPYSYSKKAEDLVKKFLEYIWVDDDLQIKTKVHSHKFGEVLEQICKGIRFDYVAAAAQRVVEHLLVDLVKKSIKRTGLSHVILSGGVFMNVKANYEILKIPEIKKLFIMPSCGDESLPIGSCYYGTLLRSKETMRRLPHIQNLYVGPEYSHEQIENALEQSEFEYKTYGKRITDEVARLLAKGEVVARLAGRMEFGARALGNRSILADASRGEVVEEINRMIKMRDFWMPFAPSILEEYAPYYIKHPELLEKVEPYFMMMTFESTPLAQEHLKAALHPYDKTLRPQLVNKTMNPEYYELMHNFMRRTKRAGLINTSFNIHGEPIVCTPEDALHTLRESGLKYVAINDFLVWKEKR